MGDEFWRTLLASAGSAGFSALAVSPLDTLRVRWQVTPAPVAGATGHGADATAASAASARRGTSANNHSGGLMRFGRGVVRREGFMRGLVLPGLAPNVLAIATCSGIRFTLYPKIRNAVTQCVGGSDGDKGAVAMTVAGFATGAFGYWVSAPFWMLKTLGQAAPELKVGKPTLSELWSQGGVVRFYRGATPLVLRGACLSAGNMLGYDGTKTLAKRNGVVDGPVLHLVASVVSAATATALAAPADITMARVHTARYRHETSDSVLRAVQSLLRERGLPGFFRGYPVFFIRMAPAFTLNLTVYEQARRLLGLGYLE